MATTTASGKAPKKTGRSAPPGLDAPVFADLSPRLAIVRIACDTGNANTKVAVEITLVFPQNGSITEQSLASQEFFVPSYLFESPSPSISVHQTPGNTAFEIVSSGAADSEAVAGVWATGDAAFASGGESDSIFIGKNGEFKAKYALQMVGGIVLSVLPQSVNRVAVFAGTSAHKRNLADAIGTQLKGEHLFRRLATHSSREVFSPECRMTIAPMFIPESFGGALGGYLDHPDEIGTKAYIALDLGGGTSQAMKGKEGLVLGDAFSGRLIIPSVNGNKLIQTFANSEAVGNALGAGRAMGAQSFSGIRDALYEAQQSEQVVYAGEDLTALWKEHVESAVKRLALELQEFENEFGLANAPIVGFGGTWLHLHFTEAAQMQFSYGVDEGGKPRTRVFIADDPLFSNCRSNLATVEEEFAEEIEQQLEDFKSELQELGKAE